MTCPHCHALLQDVGATFFGSLAQLITVLPIIVLTPLAGLELERVYLGGQQGNGMIWVLWFLSVITFTLVFLATCNGKTQPRAGATQIFVPPLDSRGDD